MPDKSPDAYRTISEVADDLALPQHVLRFWETKFSQIRPLKRGGGRRYYRPDDVELLKGIRYLLYSEGYTIKGVQRILKEQGPKAVQVLVQGAGDAMPPGQPNFAMADEPEEDAFDADAGPDGDDEPVSAPFAPPAPPTLAPYQRTAPVPAPERAYLPQVEPVPPIAAPAAALRRQEPDLFGADVFQPISSPLPPAPARVPVAPAVPEKPARPNVSFMRGGLSKLVVPAAAPSPPPAPTNVLVRRPPTLPIAEPPAPMVAQPDDATPDFDLPYARPDIAPPAPGLTPEQRRALQSALFELSECRRAIERISATRAR